MGSSTILFLSMLGASCLSTGLPCRPKSRFAGAGVGVLARTKEPIFRGVDCIFPTIFGMLSQRLSSLSVKVCPSKDEGGEEDATFMLIIFSIFFALCFFYFPNYGSIV